MALRVLHWLSRLLLAALFLYSGWVKIDSPLQFAAAISGYQLVPMPWVLPLVTYLPWLEMALGALIALGWRIRAVSMAATALLALFIAVQAITYLRGIEADCGCFGFGERISPLTIGRDALFLLPALFLVCEKRLRPRPAGPIPAEENP